MSDYNIDFEMFKTRYVKVLHDRDDELLELFIKMSIKQVQNDIDRSFEEVDSDGNFTLIDEDQNLDLPLLGAIYVCAHDLYMVRTNQSEAKLYGTNTYENLIKNYRRMGV